MGKVDNGRCIFSLTSLQIGDLQSYLSDLSLFMGNESKKVYILVDNRPWLRDLGSRPEHFWQLMVTKSRLSPFAMSKAQREKKDGNVVYPSSEPAGTGELRKFMRRLLMTDAATLSQKRVVLPVKKLRNSLILSSELQRILSGFIVFEVAWTSVRGINYINQLQSDTSLALEAKSMRRWEFNSIAQAASCASLWFSGTPTEKVLLEEYLDSAIGELFYDSNQDFSGPIIDEDICDGVLTVEDPIHCLGSAFCVYSAHIEERTVLPHILPPSSGPCKRRKVIQFCHSSNEIDIYTNKIKGLSIDESANYSETCKYISESAVEDTQYQDVLMLIRFNDHYLPFKLREVIMSDLRLLTLLEAGLPSWAIFLQSYPGFCHFYRPWMCPLTRVLYVLISVVTVLIGFYDLYKNVPVLKATASRLCGPMFEWIESWEMASRIKYLGTMLFLHNFQKAVKWFLNMVHAAQSFLSFFAQPLAEFAELFEFLFPIYNVFFIIVEGIFSIIWIGIGSSCNLVWDLVEISVLPLWFIFKFSWRIATSIVYPIFRIVWEVLCAPIRLILAISGFFGFLCTRIFSILGNAWKFVSSMLQLASTTEATVSTHQISLWRSLWNDLFSKVFRALRSILNGFLAFFAACNRHRLSIYNYIKKLIQRLSGRCRRSELGDLRMERATGGKPTANKLEPSL